MSLSEFWSQKTSKEKILLATGAGVVILGIAYHLFYKPFNQKLVATEKALVSDVALLKWMQENQSDVKRTRTGSKSTSKVPMFQLIENTFSPLQEDEAPRITRLDETRVSVNFQKVVFDKLIRSLEQLTKKKNLVVSNFSAKKLDEEGYAAVSFTLSRS